MAAPITHIALSNKIYDKLFSDKDKQAFFVGTCFPDIRYLKVIDRNKTHLSVSSIDQIYKEEPFTTGLLFHNLLDRTREDFLVSRNVYSLCPESKYVTQAVESLEDKRLYGKILDWTPFINYFKNILEQELKLGVDTKHLEHWHRTLQDYFLEKPSKKSRNNFANALSVPQEVVNEIENVVNIIENVPEVTKYIEDLYDGFEELLYI